MKNELLFMQSGCQDRAGSTPARGRFQPGASISNSNRQKLLRTKITQAVGSFNVDFITDETL